MTYAPRLKSDSAPGRTLRALICLCTVLFFYPAYAADDNTHIDQSGTLPRQGRVVFRSGLAWMDETAPVFQKLQTALGKELAARGLSLVAVKPSALEPMPKTPMPNKQSARSVPNLHQPEQSKGVAENNAAQKAQELGQAGQLPKLKLRTYATPNSDKDLPDSVRAVTAPDVTRALYARSQQAGKPVVQSFAIPGRLPKELAGDAKIADYAIVIRFAAVRAWASAPESNPRPYGPGVLVAATTIGGTSRLGVGSSAAPSPPGQNTYGTPGGYVRGYEGSAPGDVWHRDSDFYQRDYQFKHGPQPQYATPPKGLSDSVTSKGRQREFGATPLPGREHGASVVGWHLLLMDCFDLAPMRNGQKPVQVWQAAIRAPGDTDDLPTSLPKMIRAIFAAKQ